MKVRGVGRLDRWLYVRAELPEGSLPDRAVTLLSAAADHSLLWLGVAAVLAATGGRQGRRAAVRGVLSVAITSAKTDSFAISKYSFSR